MTPYGDKIWVNMDSGNGLLSDGTKPLPEPVLTIHQWGLQHLSEGNLKGNVQDIYDWYEFEKY